MLRLLAQWESYFENPSSGSHWFSILVIHGTSLQAFLEHGIPGILSLPEILMYLSCGVAGPRVAKSSRYTLNAQHSGRTSAPCSSWGTFP